MESSTQTLVLVAEDHVVNQKVVSLLLSSLGIGGEIVSTGKAAVEAASAKTYALILMDIMMPEMDGFQASFKIRQREFKFGRHTPIVACTAMDEDHVRDQCIRAGIDDFIQKPLSKSVLQMKIEKWTRIKISPLPSKPGADIKAKRLADLVVESLDPIDRGSLSMLYGLEQLDDIMVLYQSVTESLLGQLESGIKRQDVMLVGRMAHEIKGSSYAVSAREMASVCLALEQAGEHQNWPEVERLYASLGLAFARVEAYLADNQRMVHRLRDQAS